MASPIFRRARHQRRAASARGGSRRRRPADVLRDRARRQKASISGAGASSDGRIRRHRRSDLICGRIGSSGEADRFGAAMTGSRGAHPLDGQPRLVERCHRQHENIGVPRRDLDRRAGDAGEGIGTCRRGTASTRERAFQAMEAAFMIDRAVIRPQPFQQHEIFVEPGKAVLVAMRRSPPADRYARVHAAAAQLIERGDLPRGDLGRPRLPVLDLSPAWMWHGGRRRRASRHPGCRRVGRSAAGQCRQPRPLWRRPPVPKRSSRPCGAPPRDARNPKCPLNSMRISSSVIRQGIRAAEAATESHRCAGRIVVRPRQVARRVPGGLSGRRPRTQGLP